MRRAILVILAMTAASTWADARDCFNLVRLTNFEQAIEPGQIVPATDEMPAYCHVRGVINRAIRFEVTLPLENWNGRLLFSTVGGTAGTIGDITSGLPDGFAMASTDTGHEITEGTAFLKQPQALLDYAYRGVHLATLGAKSVIQAYYDREIDYSYLSGCSNGGRAALMEVTRFPTDYDGVIAGAPLYAFSEYMPWAMSVAQAMADDPLTEASFDVLAENSANACDVLDGVEDGVINDPRICTTEMLNLEGLVCDAGPALDCLTAGQIETARTIYEGLRDRDGNLVAHGVTPGAENAGDWAFWTQPSEQFDDQPIVAGAKEMLGHIMRNHPNFDIDEFDPANDMATVERELIPLDPDDPDLSDFMAHGGKLIIYQGWNDFPLRPQRALEHLADVQNTMGGADVVDGFYRLFMVPGMTHCAGGPGAWQTDYVDPLVAWREQREAPERILGTQPAEDVSMGHLAPSEASKVTEAFTRPQCVYPKLAQYRGRGDKTDASNYICR